MLFKILKKCFKKIFSGKYICTSCNSCTRTCHLSFRLLVEADERISVQHQTGTFSGKFVLTVMSYNIM